MEIEAIKIAVEGLSIKKEWSEQIRRNSILRSSVFSARIEGNRLTTDNFDSSVGSDREKKEIQNLEKAYRMVFSNRFDVKFSQKLIRGIHAVVMSGISNQAGKYRQEPWAVFNGAGMAIYKAPAAFKVPELVDDLVEYALGLKGHPAVVAGIVQFVLEKIHPFADGNGRTGRLLSTWWLEKNGFGFEGMVPMEEFVDNHRDDYYAVLEETKNTVPFVEFYLEGLATTAWEMIKKIQQPKAGDEELPPRRAEILAIISDHPLCSFDFIRRRFIQVNPKTLHYDLGKLIGMRLISKVGKTRGCLYKKSG